MKILEKLKTADKKTVLLGVLIVGVIAMTVAFAALSTSLNLNGSANVASTSWNIRFENWQKIAIANAGGHTNTAVYPEVDSLLKEDNSNVTKVSNVNVTLNQPGDMAKYTFEIRNRGSIDAKLSAVSVTDTASNSLVGYEVKCYESDAYTGTEVTTNSVLTANGGVAYCYLQVEYKEQTNAQIPGASQVYTQSAVNTSLTASWTWVQADTSSSSNSGSQSQNSGTFIKGGNTGWKLVSSQFPKENQEFEYWDTASTKIMSGLHDLNDYYDTIQTYYFVDGLAQKGLQNINGNQYYFDPEDGDNNGYINFNMLKSTTKEIGNVCYTFAANGVATATPGACGGNFTYYYYDGNDYNGSSSSSEPNTRAYFKQAAGSDILQTCLDLQGNGNFYCVNSTWDCGTVNNGVCSNSSGYTMSVINYLHNTYGMKCSLVSDSKDAQFGCEGLAGGVWLGLDMYYTSNYDGEHDRILMEFVDGSAEIGCSMPMGDPESMNCTE